MIPALIAGGEALSSVGQNSGLLSALGSTLFPSVDSMVIANKQFGWFTHPVIPPGPEALMAAKLKGFFDPELNPFLGEKDNTLFNQLMRRQGFAFGDKGYNETDHVDFEPFKKGWKVILDASAVRPGIREAFTGYLAGALDRKEFERMLRTNGANPKDWDWMLAFYSQALDPTQILELWRRNVLTEREFETYMKRLNYGIQQDIDYVKMFANAIPGPNDIIRLAIRDTFNDKLAESLGLFEELDQNQDYLLWAKAAGLGPVTIKDKDGKMVTRDFAKMAWGAHWDLPSAGQGYQFNYRGYANSRYGKSPSLGNRKEFGEKELANLLKANDYSPVFRPYLEMISFNPYTRIDVRRIRASGLIKKAEVYHNYRATGYDDEHAFLLSEWVEQDVKQKELDKVAKPVLKRTCKALALGVITEDDFTQRMTNLGMDATDVSFELTLCQMDNSTSIGLSALRSIKAGYMSGAFTRDEAKGGLQDFGINQDKTAQYLSLWDLELQAKRRTVAAGQISKWFVDGIIGIDEFVSRLTKLQYNAADVTRIVQAAELDAARRIEKAQKAAALEAQKMIEKNLKEAEQMRKRAAQMQREYEKAIRQKNKDNDMETRRLLTAFLSGRSDKNLKQWFGEGSITEDDIRQTLALKGWDITDIDRWVNSNKPEEA